MDRATIALSQARVRIAIGLTAALAPRFAVRCLAGRPATGVEPLLTRMLGARDVALGLGAVVALDRGAPVRGWFEAAALSDTADVIASLAARARMDPRAYAGALTLGGGSALLCLGLARRLDPPPPAHPHQPEAVITGHPE
jgi:hypothetical protein